MVISLFYGLSSLDGKNGEVEMTKVSVSIDVPDLKKAAAFYTEALGCTPVREQKSMTVVSAGNLEIYLLGKDADTCPIHGQSEKRTYDRHWTPAHLDFLVDDVDSIVNKVVASGGTREGGEKADWGAIAYCADPFGNGFCLINE